MGEQSASRLEGDRYQHLFSWYELLPLLDEDSPYAHGFVEHPEAGAVDDVTVHPKPGSGAPTRYFQVKWHVDQRDSYSFESFARATVHGRSLLERLFESWRELSASGPVEVWLVSNWTAAESLGRYIRGRDYRLISEFFAAPPRGGLKRALDTWMRKLGVQPDELRAFCRDLRLRLGFGSISDLEAQVDDRMARYGLRTGPELRAIAIDGVSRWIEEGGDSKRITRDSLRAFIEKHGLGARLETAPAVGLWIHGWVRRAYEQPPTIELDWTRHFHRETRGLPSTETWRNELLPSLLRARQQLADRPDGSLIDFRGKLPLSFMLAVGATFPEAAGYRFRAEQPTRGEILLWRSDARPSTAELRARVRESATEAGDLLAVLALSGDATPEVERFEADQKHSFKATLLLEPLDGPSDGSIRSEEDATAFAIQAKTRIREARNTHRTGVTHLIIYAPAAFCLFLGQRLNALGRIVTYERTVAGGYQRSVELETG